MRFTSFLLFFVCVLCLPKTNFAQTILTKAEAIKTTLANNYDIKVAQNNIAIAKNNTSRELNGYIPTVNANAGLNASLGGSNQKFSTGQENTTKNAFNWGNNASIAANYNIIDRTREAVVDQLEAIANLSDLQLRQTIENNLLTVFNNYYEVGRLSQNTAVLEKTIEVSRQRLQRAQYRYDYGQGIRLDVLNAEVDIQRDTINLLNLKNQLSIAKRNLNIAMGTTTNTDFMVDTLINYQGDLSLDQLLNDAKSNNVLVHLVNQNLVVSKHDFDIIDATRKPILGANANYNFNFSDNATGSFIDVSNSRGFAAGLTLSWNLYDGGRRQKQAENAQLNIETQQVQKEQILQQIEGDVINAWESYQNALFILQTEEKNLSINQLNFERTAEQFKVGQVNSVEFRQAQLNLLTATTNLNAAKYDAKAIEIVLLQLSGRLMDGLE